MQEADKESKVKTIKVINNQNKKLKRCVSVTRDFINSPLKEKIILSINNLDKVTTIQESPTLLVAEINKAAKRPIPVRESEMSDTESERSYSSRMSTQNDTQMSDLQILNSRQTQMETQPSQKEESEFYRLIDYSQRGNETFKKPRIESQTNPIPTKNYFGILEKLNDNDNQTSSTSKAPPKPVKIPPIILNGALNDYTSFIDFLKKLLKHNNFHVAFNATAVRIHTRSKEDHNLVCEKLFKDGKAFHTFSYRDEKVKKMVMKAAPNMNVKEIQDELEQHETVEVISVVPLRGRAAINFSYLITFKSTTELGKVLEISNIQHLRIHWERYVRRTNYAQCFRCQQLGHTKSYCGNEPKCVKCAQNHETQDCPDKEKQNAPKCANCKGQHTANYSQCPQLLKYLEIKNAARNRQQPNTTIEPRIFTSRKVTPDLSYGAITQRKTNYTSSRVQNNEQPPTGIDDLKTLLEEIKELNEICDIQKMTEIVRKIKNEMKTASTAIEKMNILIKYADAI